jgi:hypothetical protein
MITTRVPLRKQNHSPVGRASGKSYKLRVHEMYHSTNQEKITMESRSQEVPKGKIEILEYVMGKGWLVVVHIVHY